MKTNRIQFQPGLSLNQFLANYGAEHQCEEVLEKSRWPQGFQCSKCRGQEHYLYRRGRLKVFQCVPAAPRRR